MKVYYNEITSGNLQLIKSLQKQVEELKSRAVTNKNMYLDYVQQNQKLSEPLAEVQREIGELQALLKERTKDQMALRNANSRLTSIGKDTNELRRKQQLLEEEYFKVETEKNNLYRSFEEVIVKIQNQSDFQNQTLESKLRIVEENSERLTSQVQEVIQAANLDGNEMNHVLASLDQLMASKEDALQVKRFQVVKLKKGFNDSLEAFKVKLKDLGIPEDEFNALGFFKENIPVGTTNAPAGLVAK